MYVVHCTQYSVQPTLYNLHYEIDHFWYFDIVYQKTQILFQIQINVMLISNMPITYVLTYVNENKDPFENFNFQIVIF